MQFRRTQVFKELNTLICVITLADFEYEKKILIGVCDDDDGVCSP